MPLYGYGETAAGKCFPVAAAVQVDARLRIYEQERLRHPQYQERGPPFLRYR